MLKATRGCGHEAHDSLLLTKALNFLVLLSFFCAAPTEPCHPGKPLVVIAGMHAANADHQTRGRDNGQDWVGKQGADACAISCAQHSVPRLRGGPKVACEEGSKLQMSHGQASRVRSDA